MRRLLLVISCYLFVATACKQTELYERLEPIPGGEWKSSYQPTFTFNITDTLSAYNVFVTVRHTNTYDYNNLWLESSLQLPADTLLTQKLDLKLAKSDGWEGTGMDDIYEVRLPVTERPQRFPSTGPVTFTLKQIMRQDPLPGILQVGIRIEKYQPLARTEKQTARL